LKKKEGQAGQSPSRDLPTPVPKKGMQTSPAKQKNWDQYVHTGDKKGGTFFGWRERPLVVGKDTFPGQTHKTPVRTESCKRGTWCGGGREGGGTPHRRLGVSAEERWIKRGG